MSRRSSTGLVLVHSPVPVTIGAGGLAPIVAMAALFAMIGAQGGLPIAEAAVLGALGGTASLVAHELGHVRAARKLSGLRATGVSLIWLGAATRFEGAYASGRDQARVAIAGPRTSFCVALLLVPVLFLPMPMSLRDLLITLAALNVAIAVLNLIPASPLDGYKVVVGLTWSLLGSEASARRAIRHITQAWIAVELVGTAFLLVERPALGATALALGASLFGQKVYARRRA